MLGDWCTHLGIISRLAFLTSILVIDFILIILIVLSGRAASAHVLSGIRMLGFSEKIISDAVRSA